MDAESLLNPGDVQGIVNRHKKLKREPYPREELKVRKIPDGTKMVPSGKRGRPRGSLQGLYFELDCAKAKVRNLEKRIAEKLADGRK